MTQDCFAVCAQGLSKTYRLWNSPQDRLIFPLKRLFASQLPAKWQKANPQSYREFYALNDISFAIRKGESWGFIGVNGSGKSTLLKIIAGNLRPSKGSVTVDGRVVILDYSNGFNGDFTGKENIYLKATLLGLTRKQIVERYDSIVAFAELGDFINQPVKTYSSGMVSRLGFAIVAHVDADIIITDEALAVGDNFFVQKCMEFIRDFLKKGTFLFVSHSMTDILSFCQKAVWLEQGAIKIIGAASTVTQAYLEKAQVIMEESHDQQAILDGPKKKPMIVLGQPTLNECKVSNSLNNYRANSLNHKMIEAITPTPLFKADGSEDIGGAKILQVTLTDEEGESYSKVIGGELVMLTITAMAKRDLHSPIIGFQLLDRLGQILLADNSFLSMREQPFTVDKDGLFSAKFSYRLPLLPAGDYVIRVFVALVIDEGKTATLYTANNSLVIHSVTTGARHGLVGIPMLSIKFKCEPEISS